MSKRRRKGFRIRLKKRFPFISFSGASPAWYAIAVRDGFVVRKTRNPKIKGGRFAFGPYSTKGKACQVGSYQSHGTPPKGC
jgi:hypothetical protein